MAEDTTTKPLVLQSGSELLESTAGSQAKDAVMASGSDWVKAVANGRLPSHRNSGRSR